jgi:hypothetical protein
MMAANRIDVPRWVRTWTCVVGSVGVPGLIMAEAHGVNISVYIAGPVTLYAIYVASLAFGRCDSSIGELAKLMSPRRRE